ncbi:hypothetical protein GCM10009839_65370 [Catenulispora yoronensis]|uniref:RHIM domain-containing protein n=1 Tax=Catenulispora yoronensis TaxID=450799 RepID=A0ABP5GL96_9ACTN
MDSELLSSVMAQLTAALSAVGHKLLSTAGEKTADESVRLGRRLLDRLRRSKDGTPRPRLEEAVGDLADNPEDDDFRAALRAQLKRALSGADKIDDPDLAADLAGLLQSAGMTVEASGQGSIAVGRNDGIISMGDRATNTINHNR